MTGEFSSKQRVSALAPMRLSYAFGRNLTDFGLIYATSLFDLGAEVAKAKSPTDLGDAWLDFCRRQLEAFSEQLEELSTLSKEAISPAEAEEEAGLGD